jgi:hypothetical protein
MANTARARTTHGLAAREAMDKILLLAAGVIGVGGGLALKIIAVPPLVPALFSAGVLIAYVLLTWMIGKLKLEPETIGDNCYYLGFIFTLSSLAYTLYGLSAAPENIALVADIVSGFGVALSSTIVGVMMRVFLLQFRPDMVAKDRETRITLQSASRDYRTALGQSTTSLKQFALEMQQKLAEHHEHMRAESAKALEDQRLRIEEETKRSGEALHKATADAVDRSLKAVEEMVRSSAKRAEETAQASAVRTRSSLESFADELSRALDVLNAQMARLASAGGEAGATLAEGVQGVRMSTQRFQRAMEQLSANVEGAAPAIEASARRAADAMATASNSYAGKLDAVARAIDPTRLNAALVSHDARLKDVSDTLGAAAASVQDAIRIGKGLEGGMTQTAAALAAQDARMKEAVEAMRAVALAAEDAVQLSRNAGGDAKQATATIVDAATRLEHVANNAIADIARAADLEAQNKVTPPIKREPDVATVTEASRLVAIMPDIFAKAPVEPEETIQKKPSRGWKIFGRAR